MKDFFSQFDTKQIKAQYYKNYLDLQKMADKAKLTGKKVNGFTYGYLQQKANEYKSKSL